MNKTYCSALFNHIYSDNSDNYSLCCYADKKYIPQVNTSNTTPFEWFLSDYMEELRDKALSGEKIEACHKSTTIEESGFKSPRTIRFKSDEILEYEPNSIELKLRIFGNYCNLSCYMCHPYNSSSREKELKEIGMFEAYAYDAHEKPPTRKQYEKIAEDILKNIHLVGKILFTGGEPLLLPKHYDFIDRIDDSIAQNIKVSYMTNFSEINHKGVYFLDKVKKFEKADFSISCDHFGKKLEYIRYPISSYKFEKNLEKLAEEKIKSNGQITGTIHTTVSILNVEDIRKIKSYYNSKFGIKVKATNLVRSPQDFCIAHHPKKKELIQKYQNDKVHESFLYHLKKDADPLIWNRAIKYLEALDKNRGTNYRDLWPDYDYIDLIKHEFVE